MDCHPAVSIEWSPNHVPSGLYRALLLRRRPGLADSETLPAIAVQGSNIKVARDWLDEYRFVTMTPGDDDTAPLMFPHALLGSAHLMMLAHDNFPLGSFGLLHLRNHAIRYRDFGIDQPWDVSCVLARQRQVEKGLEFDFDTTISIDGESVWRSVSTFLKRGKPNGELEISPLADLFPPIDEAVPESGHFDVPHNIGRRYAKVTGDYNPIHVSSLVAKLFGFNRAIAHGMWSLARVLPELPPVDNPVRIDVSFKGPMYVTSRATIKTDTDGRFELFCGTNPRPVIVGAYQNALPDELI